VSQLQEGGPQIHWEVALSNDGLRRNRNMGDMGGIGMRMRMEMSDLFMSLLHSVASYVWRTGITGKYITISRVEHIAQLM
jgi:hypothetical protein